MALLEIKVPDIGDFKDVAVIELLVKAGDRIKLEQSLLTVESDKASMEIPSSASGVLTELKVKLGDKLNIGDLIGLLDVTGDAAATPAARPSSAQALASDLPLAAAAPLSAAAPQVTVAGGAAATLVPAPASAAANTAPGAESALPVHAPGAPPSGSLPHASPSVRKFARELGVPLEEVKGSGPKGRITPEDVQDFTRAVMQGTASTRAQAARAPSGGAGGTGEALGLLPWPKVISPSSVLSNARTSRVSRKLPGPTCTATGS